MSDLSDYKADIDAWADMWDEMQDKGMHPALEKPKPSAFAANIFGGDAFDSDSDSDSNYDYADEDLLSEAKKSPVVTTQNPVRIDTIGPDNKKPDPVWVQEDFMDEIKKLKDQLFKVENEAARMGQGKTHSEKPVDTDDKKIMKKIETLRKEIGRISDQLGIKNDPSPYKLKVKKD